MTLMIEASGDLETPTDIQTVGSVVLISMRDGYNDDPQPDNLLLDNHPDLLHGFEMSPGQMADLCSLRT